jgi:hypothetical protein
MNITDSEILKLKSNIGFSNRLAEQNNPSVLHENNHNTLTESARSIEIKFNTNIFTY